MALHSSWCFATPHHHHPFSLLSSPLLVRRNFFTSFKSSSSSSSSSSPSPSPSSSPSPLISISSFFKMASPRRPKLPEIIEAGDPVLHEAASPVPVEEIQSERIQKIIDDMISVMREAPGVGLAAPQIGIPLQIIVMEDTKEYISYVSKEDADAQQRAPFDLLVICNPKLKRKGNKSARFFEGCLSVKGYRGLVERYLEVEVSGFGRDGSPIKFDACGWKARILQHEYDHIEGLLFVDKMVPRTFRTTANLQLVLPSGCPKIGVYEASTNL